MSETPSYHDIASRLAISAQAFIGGRYTEAGSGKTFASIDPATGRHLADVASCDAHDIDLAVQAARRAFEAGHWSRAAPTERKQKLLRLADLMEKHATELAVLETLDTGKPITLSLRDDLPLSIKCIRWYAEIVDKLYDEIAPTAPSALSLIRREPLGVVGAVVPWNFPLLMACWKLGPILASGNSVVLKPAEQSSLTATRIAALAAEAGIPDGVFNVTPGLGESAGRALGLHMDVDAIAFTGSTEVGKLFMQYAGQSNMKRVGLECGGKSPNIIFADAPDLDEAATAAAWGVFYNQGEVCNAGSRVLIDEAVADRVLEKIIDIAGSIKSGDPLDPQTEMGAMVDAVQSDRVMGYIAAGTREGARLRAGGSRAARTGEFIEPTIFDQVRPTMRIAKEEIFGPVLAAMTFKNEAEAVAIANDTIYGLAAGLWTKDLDRTFRVSSRLRAGVVWVNCFDVGDMSSPFGGFKQSGFGRDKSIHAMEKYTDLKATWIKLDAGKF